ncbi:nuclear pore complex protein Nup85 [Eurytemora carolleeae]|uniref:nuclear pore complex protein Nup85 n=1 Tax=Eurytemora carolleeae TaxID=1294199 RepID=UPI000C76E836|nr:nuclear pore complex protein Nup85 [Eurytemora carolleeae]|eukprot:XP_023344077.1 nuclear pore complex protein Nup85-like [Eurytemora affinis]
MATVSIPDRNGVGQRLAVGWGVGNVLALTPTQKQSPADTRQEANDPVEVHEVRWETVLYQPIFRKLVNESVSTFLGLQALCQGEGNIPTDQLVKISRQYRSIIRDCEEQLNTLSETSSAAAAAHYTAQSEMLYKLELIWNLAEILIIDTRPGGFVMNQLLHWIGLHFKDCEDGARSVISESPDTPEDHVLYWSSLQEFILQGGMDPARNLLRLHSDFSSDMFISLDELLRKMPVCTPGGNMVDFEMKWRNWQVEVVGRVQAGDYAVYPELDHIAQILAGSEDALNTVADRCETWYQWMVYRLLYMNPTVKGYDLSIYAQQAMDRFGGLQSMTSLDSVLLGIIELDIPEVIRELCLTLDNFWFPAHLLDLLQHTGVLSTESRNSSLGAGLREFLVLDYATCLMSHNSLWQLGVLYFDHCPVQGKQRLEAMLERIPLTSDYKAGKILEIAGERGLHTIITSTCKVSFITH